MTVGCPAPNRGMHLRVCNLRWSAQAHTSASSAAPPRRSGPAPRRRVRERGAAAPGAGSRAAPAGHRARRAAPRRGCTRAPPPGPRSRAGRAAARPAGRPPRPRPPSSRPGRWQHRRSGTQQQHEAKQQNNTKQSRARAGKIPGGLAYGYEVVPPASGSQEAGERRIKPDEAERVQRIFLAYAAGKSPRVIARELNAAGLPGPGGRPWGDTTIRGQVDRGTGLLNNSLYIGRLSWNRCSYVKDPRTGRRVARPNSADQWEEVQVPDLRIIDQSLWDQVRARQASLEFATKQSTASQPLNDAHRTKFLLSGLLSCGVCGGGYTIIGRDRYGCATRRCKGTCDNGVTIRRQIIESRVLGGLKDHMLAPDLVAEFVRAFAEEIATAQRDAAGVSQRLKGELADVERRLEGVLKAVENGAWSDALQLRLQDLEARKKALAAEMREAPTVSLVRLHPNAAGIYRQKVAELEAALGSPDICGEAAEALGSMIERVVLMPDKTAPNRLRAELHGDLAVILSAVGAGEGASKANSPPRGGAKRAVVGVSQLSVVAGAGFEPATFRL